MSKTYHLAHSA